MKPPAFQFYADDFLGAGWQFEQRITLAISMAVAIIQHKAVKGHRTAISRIINATRPCGASEWELLAVWPSVRPSFTRCVAQAF
jgi:hypothetical protein